MDHKDQKLHFRNGRLDQRQVLFVWLLELSLLVLAAEAFFLNGQTVPTVTDCMNLLNHSEVVAWMFFDVEAFNAKTGWTLVLGGAFLACDVCISGVLQLSITFEQKGPSLSSWG